MARRNTTMASMLGSSGKKRPPSAMQQRLNAASGRAVKDWLSTTFATDTNKKLVAANWLILAGFIAWAYLVIAEDARGGRLLIVLSIVWLLATFVRGATLRPRVRKTRDAMYQQLQRACGWPRNTAQSPVKPANHFTIKSWARGKPTAVQLTMAPDAPAANLLGRAFVEQTLTNSVETRKGYTWAVTWDSPTTATAQAAPVDSVRMAQQATVGRTIRVLCEAFKVSRASAADHGHDLVIEQWDVNAQGEPTNRPTVLLFAYGTQPEPANAAFRDAVERQCDANNLIPGLACIYDWDEPGAVRVSGAPPDSLPARRKLIERRIADQIAAGAGRGKDPVLVRVTGWVTGAVPVSPQQLVPAPVGTPDPAVTALTAVSAAPVMGDTAQLGVGDDGDVPQRIVADLGTRQFGDQSARYDLERKIEDDLRATWPDLVYVHEWSWGATATLTMTAYPIGHEVAMEKMTHRQLQSAVATKLGTKRDVATVDIDEWVSDTDQYGVLVRRRPVRLRVNFGAFDVSKADTRDAAMAHLDQLTAYNDWNYRWHEAEGFVDLTAVPPLPDFVAFPVPGTAQFDEWNTLVRQGVVRFGPAKGGGHIDLDLNECPHALIGGKPGAGKSVALSIVLFGALYNPDLLEIWVCDPKRTDFTWTPEFPGCIRFGDTDERIIALVAAVVEEMDRRQSLLNRRQVRNIGQLRALYEKHPEMVEEDGPAPRRLILFFDELADFLAKSANKDIEEAKDDTRAHLEKMARLARAMEINIIAAAQKPGANVISTQLRDNVAYRMCIGKVAPATSMQIMESNHGQRFPEHGTPKGRAWTLDPKAGYCMCQVYWLPDDTSPFPPAAKFPSDAVMPGAKDLLRERLRSMGYRDVKVPNEDGGLETRWIHRGRVETVDMQDVDIAV